MALIFKTPSPPPAPASQPPAEEEPIPVAGYTPKAKTTAQLIAESGLPESTFHLQQAKARAAAKATLTGKPNGGAKLLPKDLEITTEAATKKALKVNKGDVGPALTKVVKTKNKPPKADDLDAILGDVQSPPEFPGVDSKPERDTTSNALFNATLKDRVEFRRLQAHRLLLRGVPKHTIASHLGITKQELEQDVKAIYGNLREEMRNLDYTMYIGSSVSFYEECRNIALRLATDTNEKSNGVKMQALRTAVAAEDAKHNFLARIGLFKHVSPTDPFNAIQTGRQGSYSDENDLNSFMQSIAHSAQGTKLLQPHVPPVEAEDARTGD